MPLWLHFQGQTAHFWGWYELNCLRPGTADQIKVAKTPLASKSFSLSPHAETFSEKPDPTTHALDKKAIFLLSTPTISAFSQGDEMWVQSLAGGLSGSPTNDSDL